MSFAAESTEEEEAPAPLISDHAAGDVALPTKLDRQTTPQVEAMMLKGASPGPLVERTEMQSKQHPGNADLFDEEDEEEEDEDAPAPLVSDHAPGDVPILTKLGRQTTPQVEEMLSKEQYAKVTGALTMATMNEEPDVPDEDAPAPMPQDHALGDVLKPVMGRQVTPTIGEMVLDAPPIVIASIDDAPAQMPQDHSPGDVLKPVLGRQVTPACTIDATPKEKAHLMEPMVEDEDDAGDEDAPTPRKTREDTPRPEDLRGVSDKLELELTVGAIAEIVEEKEVSFEQGEQKDPDPRKLRMGTPMPKAMQEVANDLKKKQEGMDAVQEAGHVKEDDKQTNTIVDRKEEGEAAASPDVEAASATNKWSRGFVPNLMRQFRSPPNFNFWAKKPKEGGK